MYIDKVLNPDLVVQPLPEPDLKEILFWITIMKEHSLFIFLGLPCDQVNLRDEAQKFFRLFEGFEAQASRSNLNMAQLKVAVLNVRNFKRRILHLYTECKIRGGSNPILIYDHIARESEYFLEIIHKMEKGEHERPNVILQELVFWIRIMAEHAKFMRQLTDPSEERILHNADSFAAEFDIYLTQARNLESMLWDFKTVGDLRRFITEIKKLTQNFRDFKAMVEMLIVNCEMLSLIPPELAHHIKEEADKFLEIIGIIQERLDP